MLGHWLPRALADIAVQLSAFGGDRRERRDWLLAWGLPHTADTDDADEEEGRQERLDKTAEWINEA